MMPPDDQPPVFLLVAEFLRFVILEITNAVLVYFLQINALRLGIIILWMYIIGARVANVNYPSNSPIPFSVVKELIIEL